jgi:hypothetical protein
MIAVLRRPAGTAGSAALDLVSGLTGTASEVGRDRTRLIAEHGRALNSQIRRICPSTISERGG